MVRNVQGYCEKLQCGRQSRPPSRAGSRKPPRSKTSSATSSARPVVRKHDCLQKEMHTSNRSQSLPPRPQTRRRLFDMPNPQQYTARTHSTDPPSEKGNQGQKRKWGSKTSPNCSCAMDSMKQPVQKVIILNCKQVNEQNKNEKPTPAPRKHSKKRDTTYKNSIAEHEYLQFSLRITEDIIRNDLYRNEEMRRVFNSHIEANRGRLDMTKMNQQIERLSKELNIPPDDVQDDQAIIKSQIKTARQNAETALTCICCPVVRPPSDKTENCECGSVRNLPLECIKHKYKTENINNIPSDTLKGGALKDEYSHNGSECDLIEEVEARYSEEPEGSLKSVNYFLTSEFANCVRQSCGFMQLPSLTCVTERTEPTTSNTTCTKYTDSYPNTASSFEVEEIEVLPGFENLESSTTQDSVDARSSDKSVDSKKTVSIKSTPMSQVEKDDKLSAENGNLQLVENNDSKLDENENKSSCNCLNENLLWIACQCHASVEDAYDPTQHCKICIQTVEINYNTDPMISASASVKSPSLSEPVEIQPRSAEPNKAPDVLSNGSPRTRSIKSAPSTCSGTARRILSGCLRKSNTVDLGTSFENNINAENSTELKSENVGVSELEQKSSQIINVDNSPVASQNSESNNQSVSSQQKLLQTSTKTDNSMPPVISADSVNSERISSTHLPILSRSVKTINPFLESKSPSVQSTTDSSVKLTGSQFQIIEVVEASNIKVRGTDNERKELLLPPGCIYIPKSNYPLKENVPPDTISGKSANSKDATVSTDGQDPHNKDKQSFSSNEEQIEVSSLGSNKSRDTHNSSKSTSNGRKDGQASIDEQSIKEDAHSASVSKKSHSTNGFATSKYSNGSQVSSTGSGTTKKSNVSQVSILGFAASKQSNVSQLSTTGSGTSKKSNVSQVSILGSATSKQSNVSQVSATISGTSKQSVSQVSTTGSGTSKKSNVSQVNTLGSATSKQSNVSQVSATTSGTSKKSNISQISATTSGTSKKSIVKLNVPQVNDNRVNDQVALNSTESETYSQIHQSALNTVHYPSFSSSTSGVSNVPAATPLIQNQLNNEDFQGSPKILGKSRDSVRINIDAFPFVPGAIALSEDEVCSQNFRDQPKILLIKPDEASNIIDTLSEYETYPDMNRNLIDHLNDYDLTPQRDNNNDRGSAAVPFSLRFSKDNLLLGDEYEIKDIPARSNSAYDNGLPYAIRKFYPNIATQTYSSDWLLPSPPVSEPAPVPVSVRNSSIKEDKLYNDWPKWSPKKSEEHLKETVPKKIIKDNTFRGSFERTYDERIDRRYSSLQKILPLEQNDILNSILPDNTDVNVAKQVQARKSSSKSARNSVTNEGVQNHDLKENNHSYNEDVDDIFLGLDRPPSYVHHPSIMMTVAQVTDDLKKFRKTSPDHEDLSILQKLQPLHNESSIEEIQIENIIPKSEPVEFHKPMSFTIHEDNIPTIAVNSDPDITKTKQDDNVSIATCCGLKKPKKKKRRDLIDVDSSDNNLNVNAIPDDQLFVIDVRRPTVSTGYGAERKSLRFDYSGMKKYTQIDDDDPDDAYDFEDNPYLNDDDNFSTNEENVSPDLSNIVVPTPKTPMISYKDDSTSVTERYVPRSFKLSTDDDNSVVDILPSQKTPSLQSLEVMEFLKKDSTHHPSSGNAK